MSWIKKSIDKLSKELKFSASDPKNFVEVWSFQSTTLRIISLFIVVLIILTVLFTYLAVSGPLSGYFTTNDVPIERKQLEDQRKHIDTLTAKIKSQEEYLSNMTRILQGENPLQDLSDSLVGMPEINYDSLNDKMTDSERELLEKINEDIRSVKSGNDKLAIFGNPVVGEISQNYNKNQHSGIDIVTKKDAEVKACLAGTVIYSGFSRKDGYLIIIDHGNGFLSVNKHCKAVFKKVGDKVQLGDPIAIVGSTGENTSGPHLHFELWHNQKPVNPQDYISFKN